MNCQTGRMGRPGRFYICCCLDDTYLFFDQFAAGTAEDPHMFMGTRREVINRWGWKWGEESHKHPTRDMALQVFTAMIREACKPRGGCPHSG